VIFDTDVIIWLQRGNKKAANIIEETAERHIAILSYMELLQSARDKKQHAIIKNFLRDFNFTVLPLTENIGHRALIYVEEYALSFNLRAADAIIAATAIENNLLLISGNVKHFKPIKDLRFKPFMP